LTTYINRYIIIIKDIKEGFIMEQIFYTVKEVALKLKLTDETIREKLRNKKILGVKIGKSWRVTEENLNDFMRCKNE
jgi:excisionase family DNA binding protein